MARKKADKQIKEKKPTPKVLEDIMAESLAVYSEEVILNRAIPDSRDGMKPVQRHIMYILHKDKLGPNVRHLKTQTVVGKVMPYHAHGDGSIKTAIDNLSQDWVLSLPLVNIHGNNGGIDGAPPAAGRYTETRQDAYAGFLLDRVDTGASVMIPNYDDTLTEPEVLPAKLPFVLANGAFGIAEGVATAILPHNPAELLEACIYLVKTPTARTSTLAGIIKGPDFPTGGILLNAEEPVKEELTNGVARYTVRGVAKIQMPKGENPYIDITEIPWNPWGISGKSVNIPNLIESMDAALEPMRGLGILDIEDLSDETTGELSIRIHFRKNCTKETIESVLQHLYQKSLLQIELKCSNMMISDGSPVVLGVAEVLRRFNDFRLQTLKNIWSYDVDEAKSKLELVEARIIAFSDPDGLMKLTRASKDRADMVARLIKKYKLTTRQAEHIADMPLHRFNDAAKLVGKAKTDKKDLEVEIKNLNKLLTDEKAATAALLDDLRRTKKEVEKIYGPRKTQLMNVDLEAASKKIAKKTENLIVDKKVVAFAAEKFIAKLGEVAYSNQTASGKGKDYPAYPCSTRDWVYAVCNNGQSVGVRADTLDTVNLDANSESLSKFERKLNPSASFVGICAVNSDTAKNTHLILVTKNGFIKSIDGSTVLKDSMRAKNKYIISSCHGLRDGDDEIVLARMFTDEEMKKVHIEADVSWDGKTKRITAHRDIPLSDYIDMKHGLSGSGRRDIKSNSKGGTIDKIYFTGLE